MCLHCGCFHDEEYAKEFPVRVKSLRELCDLFDPTFLCIICGKPVRRLSMGGPIICPSCDCGTKNDHNIYRKNVMSKVIVGRNDDTSIDIACTWGEGADVSVILQFNPEVLIQYIQEGKQAFLPLDLTANEAMEIGLRFSQAGAKAKRATEAYHRNMKEGS